MMTYQWWCFVSSYFTVIEFNNIELQKQVIWRVINTDNLIDQKSIDYVSFSRWSVDTSIVTSACSVSCVQSTIGRLSFPFSVDYRPTISSFMGRLSVDDMPTIDRPLVNSSTTMDKN